MKTVSSIKRTDVSALTPYQVRLAEEIGTLRGIFLVDDIPTVAINSDEPTHWLQNGSWERVTFLTITETNNSINWQARRWCSGDQSWTDWTDISAEEYKRRKSDSSFEFRPALSSLELFKPAK